MAREQLLEDERFFPTPYMHHNGWLTLRLDGEIDGAKSRICCSTVTGSRPSSGW